jgi:uncharacterized protein with HEPN domain
MRPDSRDLTYLWDMLDAALAIQAFVQDKTYADYLADRMLRGAVERHIEIIGEAARRVSAATTEALPDIPWRAIVGQRNVLAHEYAEVLHETVSRTATRRIPELIAILRGVVPDGAAPDENAAESDSTRR